MNEKNRRILLVIILIMAVIWAGYNYPFGSQAKPSQELAKAEQTQQTQAQAPQPAIAAPSALDTLPEISAAELKERNSRPWPRDPFYRRHARSKQHRKQGNGAFKLKAIIYNDSAPSAYLNGRVVHQGDIVNDAKVVKITPNSVTLRIGKEYRKIKLK